MQEIINSGNISIFACDVTLDVFNKTMIFDTSASEYLNSPAGAGCEIAFEVLDQNNVKLAEIDFANPQIPDASTESEYTLDISYLNYNFLFINYKITAAIKDTSTNEVFYLYFPVKKICIPKDFTDYGYVPGTFLLKVDCSNSLLTVKEATVFIYDSKEPDEKVTSGTLYYPLGTISPIVFEGTPFTNNSVYTGTYKISNTTTATYSLNDGFFVEVAYVTDAEWYFNCEKRMVDVMCCWVDTQEAYLANCDNAKGARYKQQLDQASIYMLSGLIKEAAGSDASTDADAVKKILNCNCGRGSIKQIQADPVNPNIYNIIITGTGGTTVAAPTTIGNTKTYVVNSKTYVTGKRNPLDLAFSITVDTATLNTVKYLIEFNYNTMANYILTEIGGDDTLLTQFNSLVTATSNIDLSNLNGRCVIDLSSTNYFLSYRISNAANLVVSTLIGSTNYDAPGGLLVSDSVGIATWLNGLGLGTFEVGWSATSGAYYINILSNDNPNNPVSVSFNVSGLVSVPYQKTNVSLIAFLQAVVDYLCELTGLQVYLGRAIDLCSIDYNDDVVITTYGETTLMSDLAYEQSVVICDIVARIKDITGVTCEKLLQVFSPFAGGVFGSTDLFFGTMGGFCYGITREQAAMAIISAINTNATVKAAFCDINCESPATCPDVGNTSLAMSGSDIGVYGVTWTPANPVSTQTVTVRYRVNGTLTWTVSTNALQILPNGNLAGSTPYLITGVSTGITYDVWVTNNCGGNGFIKQITTPTGTVYTRDYLLDNDIYNICGGSPVTLYSSLPFATGVVLYTDIGLTIPVTGYIYVAPNDTGAIFDLDTSTGVVGADTGLTCGTGIDGTYILGNSTGSICADPEVTLYTDIAFGTGAFLFTDTSLSTPVTGYDFVVNTADNHIYNVDNATGEVLSDTGLSCSTNTVRITNSMGGVSVVNVTGIPGFTPSPAFPVAPGGISQGIHSAFTGAINVQISGSPVINPSNMTLYINGTAVDCRLVTPVSGLYYSFDSFTYASGDVIYLSLGISGCTV